MTILGVSIILTIVDLDVADSIGGRDRVAHLARVVVAPREQVLALHLLAVMAEAVATRSQVCIVL